jgi:hypothetical protein
MQTCASLVLLLLASGLAGCGGTTTPKCGDIVQITVTPETATVDHTAAPPANSQQFRAFDVPPAGCSPRISSLSSATWSVSDPVNVSVSNVVGPTYGVATCKAATAGAVTLTAVVPATAGGNVSATAALTCN